MPNFSMPWHYNHTLSFHWIITMKSTSDEVEKKEPRLVYIPPWPFTPSNQEGKSTDLLGAGSFLSFGTPPPAPQSEAVIISSTQNETQQQGSFIGSIFQFGAVDGDQPTIPRNNPASPFYESRRQSINKEKKTAITEVVNESVLHSLLQTSTKAPEQGMFEEQVVLSTPPVQEQVQPNNLGELLELQRQLETTKHVQVDLETLQERFSQLAADKAKSDQCVLETEHLVQTQTAKLEQQMQHNADLQLRLNQHIAVCQRDHGDKLSTLLLTLDTANRKLDEQRKSYDTEVQSLRAELAAAQRLGQTAAMFENQAEQLQKELTVANADRAALASLRSELRSDQERLAQLQMTSEQRQIELQKTSDLRLADQQKDSDLRLAELQKASEFRLSELFAEGQKQMSEIRELKNQLVKEQSEMEDLRTRLHAAESAGNKSNGELTLVRKQNAELLKDNVEKTKEIADLAIQRRAEKFEVERLQSALDTQVKKDIGEMEQMQQQLADLIESGTNARRAAAETMASMEALSLKDAQELAALRTQLEAERKENTRKIGLLAGAAAAADKAVSVMEQQARQNHGEMDRLKQLLASAVTEFETMSDQAQRSRDEIASLHASSTETIADLQTQLKKVNSELTSLTASTAAAMATANKQIDALTAQGKKYAEEIAALKKQLADGSMEITRLEAQLVADQNRYREAQQLLESRLKDDKARYQQETEKLESQHHQSRKILEDRLVNADQQQEQLQQQLAVAREEVAALSKEIKKKESRVSALEIADKKGRGEVEKMVKQVGDKASEAIKMFALAKKNKDEATKKAAENSELTARLEEVEEKLRTESDQHERLQKQLKKVLEEGNDLSNACAEKDGRITDLESQGRRDREDLIKVRSELTDSLEQCRSLELQGNKMREEITTGKKQLAECQSRTSELEAARAADDEEINKLRRQAKASQLQVEESLQLTDNERQRGEEIDGQLKKSKEEMDRIKGVLASTEEELEKSQEDVRRVKKQLSEMTTTKAIAEENATIELSQLRSEVMRLKKQCSEVTAAKAVVDDALTASESKHAWERDANDRLKKQLAELAATKTEMESAAEGLELRLKREASDVATLRIDLAAVTEALEDSERTIEDWKIRGKKLDQDRRDAVDQHEALTIVKTALDKELDRCKLQAQKDATEMIELRGVIADLEEQMARTSGDVAALKHQLRGATEDASDALIVLETRYREEVSLLKRQVAEKTAELVGQQSDRDDLFIRINDLEGQAKRDQSEMARLNDEIGQLAAEGVAATGQGSKYKEEAAALLQELEKTRQLLVSCDDDRRSKDLLLGKLQQQAADDERRLADSEQRLVDSERRGDEVVDTLANLRMELHEVSIVADDATELRALCSRLQQDIDDMKRRRASDSDMITETTQELEDVTKAKALLEQKLIDLERKLQQEVETNTVLWAESNAIKLQLDKTGSATVDAAQQIAHLEAALRAAKDEINQQIKAVTALTTAHTAAERRIADMERDRVSHTEEMSGMMTMVEVTSALRGQADKRVLVLEEQHRQDAEALRSLRQQIEDLEEDKSEVSKKLRTMAAQMQRDEKELETLRTQWDQIQLERAGKYENESRESVQREHQIGVLEAQVADLEQQRQSDVDVVKKLRLQLEEVSSSRVECQQQVDHLQTQSAADQKEMDSLRAQLQDQKNKIATELDSDRQQQQQQQQDATTIVSLEKQLAEAKKDSIISTEHMTSLATKDSRIVELEKLLAEAKEASSAMTENMTALATKDSRIAELEKQLVEAKKDVSASTEHMTALATKDNRIAQLEEQLVEAKKDSSAMTEHMTSLATKDSRIAELEAQLSATSSINSATKEHRQQVVDVTAPSDAKRVQDVEQVNAILEAFANDEDFQADLHRPAVQAALSRCWDSRTARVRVPRQQISPSAKQQQGVDDASVLNQSDISGSRDISFAESNNDDDEEEDEGYQRIEPLLREFEQVCDMARIAMPLSHLLSKKTFLSTDAVSAAYGEDFVNHHYRIKER